MSFSLAGFEHGARYVRCAWSLGRCKGMATRLGTVFMPVLKVIQSTQRFCITEKIVFVLWSLRVSTPNGCRRPWEFKNVRITETKTYIILINVPEMFLKNTFYYSYILLYSDPPNVAWIVSTVNIL